MPGRAKTTATTTATPIATALGPTPFGIAFHIDYLRCCVERAVTATDTNARYAQFISGLTHLESGVHELKRAYVSQFNTLLPEGHPGRLAIPFFGPPQMGTTSVVPPTLGTAGIPVVAPGTEANTKRKRKPHDPNAPKRALTSYFLFMSVNKPLIKEMHPDWSAQQISDESEKRWSNISEQERAVSDTGT